MPIKNPKNPKYMELIFGLHKIGHAFPILLKILPTKKPNNAPKTAPTTPYKIIQSLLKMETTLLNN